MQWNFPNLRLFIENSGKLPRMSLCDFLFHVLIGFLYRLSLLLRLLCSAAYPRDSTHLHQLLTFSSLCTTFCGSTKECSFFLPTPKHILGHNLASLIVGASSAPHSSRVERHHKRRHHTQRQKVVVEVVQFCLAWRRPVASHHWRLWEEVLLF